MPGGSVYKDHTFNMETAPTSHETSTIHRIRTYIYAHTHIRTCIHTYIHTYIHTHTHRQNTQHAVTLCSLPAESSYRHAVLVEYSYLVRRFSSHPLGSRHVN
jgi:hypothetical protein